MLKIFLLNSLLSNATYLGYQRRFLNFRMCLLSIGVRCNVDLHSLTHLLFNFKKLLSVFTAIWKRFGLIWVVAPRQKYLMSYYTKAERLLIEQILYFWFDKWSFGALLKRQIILKTGLKYQYPHALFYPNYTFNKTKLFEPSRAGLLQLGLADTNSGVLGYNFLVNANEKSVKSYVYFLNTLYASSLSFLFILKKEFLFG